MHALRVHRGSYLHENLRQQWLSEGERQTMEAHGSAGVQAGAGDSTEQKTEREKSGFPAQWPLFGSPTLTTIRVPSYRVREGTIYFVVQPTLEGFRWSVEKTYEDFAVLHRTLVDHHGIDKALLPSRKLFGLFGAPKPQYLKEMQIKLDHLLKTVVQRYPVPPRALLMFCNYPFCDVLSITQALSLYIFEEGEHILSNNKAVFMSPTQLHCIGRRMTLPLASSGTGLMKDDFGNLLDFLMQLQKLKIAPSTEDKFTLSSLEDVTFDLSLFKSLTTLVIDSIEVRDLQGREALTGVLEGLDIRRCLSSLQEVLVVYPADPATPTLPVAVDHRRAMKWMHLKRICFKLNNITSIDDSLPHVPCLESLDLSYNYIERIENLTELPHLKVVDLSHNKVSEVCDLHLMIGNLSKLGLAHNQLTSLEGFAKCLSLAYLDLSSNMITEVAEVAHLSGLPVLEDLYLVGNPIKQSSSYRSNVFSQLPVSANQISLDAKKATQDELELSASLVGSKTHRRIPSRTVDIKPDRYDPTTQEAQDEFEVSTSVTIRLEEMRKTGGDKWLSLLNTDRTKQHTATTPDTDDVVAPQMLTKGKEKRKKHRKHHQNKPAHESPIEREPPTPVVNENPFPVEAEEEEELSKELQDLIHQLQTEKIHLSDFPVTVMEYSGPLDALSSRDVDQKLVNSRLEECSICVDTSVMRLVETVLSTSKTRCQRDLALLEDIRFHEGKKNGVCLRFSQFGGDPYWVIYCVHDIVALARLYVTVQQGLKATQSSLPQVTVSEETDGSPVFTQSDPVPDSLSKPAIVTQTVVDGVRTDIPAVEQLTKQPSELPLAIPSGMAQVHEMKGARSRSPSPRREDSPKQLLNSPISPVKSTTTKSSTWAENQDAVVSGGASVEASPASLRSTALVPAAGDVQSAKPKRRSPSPGRKATADHIAETSRRAKPTSKKSPSPKRRVGSPDPTKVASNPEVPHVRAATAVPKNSPNLNSHAVHSTGMGDTQTVVLPNPVTSDIVASATKLSSDTSLPLPLVLGSGKDSKPTKLTSGVRKIVKKPGLASESLVSFFSGKIAREQKEVLMNILWGGASLTSTPGCEVEAGLFVSDKGLYLLQIMDTESDNALSWHTQNVPLICSFHAYYLTLSQVKIGIFDQSITLECYEKGTLKSLVVFPRTDENMLGLLDNLKAALDSSRIPHRVTTVQESLLSMKDDSSSMVFVNPDVSDLQRLKESLVKPKVMARLCNHMVGFPEPSSSFSFTEEVKRASEEAAGKFEILQYVVVSEISSDMLPISNGTTHFRPNVLVLTNSALYLCKDELASWPTDPDSPVSPPFSRCTVLDSYPIESVTGIEMCDKAQAIVLISDPIYEFRISFCVDDIRSTRGTHNWQLCVYDRQYIDQFISCLQLLWRDVHHTTLSITYTAEPLTTVLPSPSPPTKTKQSHPFSEKCSTALYDPTFYTSKALMHLASLTSSQRLHFFKEHISEAEFLKSDEVPLAVFLGFCSTREREFTQIEACIIASQYAIYLVSDVDNIHRWLDGGGASSFSRMSLLNKQGADRARCFFRLWLNEIKEVQMGFFYLSMQLTTSKSEHNFTVHSQDAFSMLALLSALSCSTNLRNTFEEKIFDELLSDYIDLGGESLASKAKQAQKNVKPNVEFREPSLDSQETLKQILLCISPSITRSSTIEQSTSGLQIILGQVMVMIEELNIRGTRTVRHQLQLVLLSNYGLFVCANSAGEDISPAVLEPADLKVKRWCHIDLIEQVEVVSPPRLQQCKGHVFCINLQSQRGTEGHTLVLVAQNGEQLKHFIYYLSLLWYERNEKCLPVYTI